LVESAVVASLERFLEDYLSRMAEKLAKGEKLTQAEAAILLAAINQREMTRLSQRIDQVRTDLEGKIDDTNRRIDDLKTMIMARFEDTNRRIDDTNKRIEDTRTELLSKIDDTNKRIEDTNRRIDDTNKRVDETNRKIDELRADLTSKIQDIKEDTAYLKRSFDGLRDTIISILTEKK
jgi:chromosome segregation ATPase